MSALGESLLALIPFAMEGDGVRNAPVPRQQQAVEHARDALRKHAPCEGCGGDGRSPPLLVTCGHVYGKPPCPACSGAGWTPASVDAAIARKEERARLDAAVIAAAEQFVDHDDGWNENWIALNDAVTKRGEFRE